MIALDICNNCKFFDDVDFPNLWCKKLSDIINGCSINELADLGCNKMQIEQESSEISWEE